MKKILSGFFCLLFFMLSTCLSANAVVVPANTSIFITPDEKVTSKDKNIEKINASITNDVVVDGVLVFKAGDKATLTVDEVEKARCWGKGGQLTIINGYAFDAKGHKQKILLSKKYYGKDREWTKVCGVVSLFFLWPLALVGFVHGAQAVVSNTGEIETNLASQYNFE